MRYKGYRNRPIQTYKENLLIYALSKPNTNKETVLFLIKNCDFKNRVSEYTVRILKFGISKNCQEILKIMFETGYEEISEDLIDYSLTCKDIQPSTILYLIQNRYKNLVHIHTLRLLKFAIGKNNRQLVRAVINCDPDLTQIDENGDDISILLDDPKASRPKQVLFAMIKPIYESQTGLDNKIDLKEENERLRYEIKIYKEQIERMKGDLEIKSDIIRKLQQPVFALPK